MNNFIKIVKRYENISRLGTKIINNRDLVRRSRPEELSEEIKKQEERIDEFSMEIKKANEEWEKNPYSKNWKKFFESSIKNS